MKILIINDPFDRANRIVKELEFSGCTIADYKSALKLDSEYVCAVSGKLVADDYVPCTHDEIVFVADLKNNASSWLNVAAGSALIVVGVATQQYWIAGMGGSMIAGVALGMIAKQFAPRVDAALGTFENSQTYTWDGIQNIYGENEPVPVLFGRHRVGGNVIAGFVSGDTTEGLQTNKYLHLLFAVSEGEVWGIEPDSIMIDGNRLADYDSDARVYYTTGTASQDLSSFGDSFSKIRRRYLFSSKRLSYNTAFPYTLKESADSALITIAFPALFDTEKDGDIVSKTVKIRLEFAPADSTEWTIAAEFDCSAAAKSSSEFDYLMKFPAVSNWKIRVTRLSEEITEITASGDSYLKAVEEIIDARINYKHTAVLGIVLKATDKISGSIPTVTSVWKGRKVADVRTMLVTEEAYRNPANLVYDLLRNARYALGRKISSENIDVVSLREFADYCDETVTYKVIDPESGIETTHTEKRFEFDIYLDTASSADEILQKIVQTCRAKLIWDGVRVKVVIDRAGTAVQMFNMGNIGADSFSVTTADTADIPNQIDADFADADNDYERTTVSVADSERIDEPVNSKSVQLFGLTTQARVQRECRFNLRKLKGTGKIVTFDAEIGAVVSEIGDIVLVQHDSPKYGNGGRVHLADNFIEFEKPVSVIAGEQYGLIVRRKDNTFYKHTITATQTEEINGLSLSDIDFEENDIWAFGVIDKEAKPHIITSITKGRTDHTVKIVAAEYNASVYIDDGVKVATLKYSALGLTKVGQLDDDGNVVAVTPQIPLNPKQILIPFVTNISIAQSGMYALIDGFPMTNVTVTWDRISISNVTSSFISRYEVLLSDDLQTWASVWQSGGSSAVLSNIKIGKAYYVAVRAYSSYGTSNDPIGAGEHYGFTVSMPLMGAISGITCGAGIYAINIAVSFSASSVFAACELWMSETNNRDNAQLLGIGASGQFSESINEIGATRYFWARLKDIFGNYNGWYPESATTGIVGITSYDAGLLLDYLEGEIGAPQLAPDLLKKVSSVDAINTALTGLVFYESGAFYYDDDYFVSTAASIIDVDGRLVLQKNQISELQTQTGTVITDVAQAKLDITAMKSDMGEMSAAIEQRATIASVNASYVVVLSELSATKDDVEGLKGQLVFKVDVNGVATGIGIYGSEEGSEIVMLYDKLYCVKDKDGTPVQILTLGSVNGTEQLGFRGDMIIDGTIAGKSIAATAQILLKDGGTVTLGNSNIIMETAGSDTGRIIVAKDGGTAGNDYAVLSDGDMQFYYYNPATSSHVPYKSLRRLETGVAYNNTPVTIPGIWRNQPKIKLFPANLQSYNSSYANQSQSFLIEVASINGVNGVYTFTPRAQLVLSSSVVSAVLNYVAANNSDAVYGAGTSASPANTTAITVNVKLMSVRGSGVAGAYKYRNVSYRINYGTGVTAYKTIGLGATLDYVSDSLSVSVPAAAYNVSVEAYAADAGNDFTVSGAAYEYWSGTSDTGAISKTVSVHGTTSTPVVMPDLSIPTGYEVYQVDWSAIGTSTDYAGFTISGVGFSTAYNRFPTSKTTDYTYSWTNSYTGFAMWDPTSPTVNVEATTGNSSVQYQDATLKRLVATVHARKAITNSTTPENTLIFESVNYALAAAVVLSEGTVAWEATGE